MNEANEHWSKANWKKPLILASALVVLGLVVYWLEFSYRPKQEESEELQKRLFALEDKQIRQITLETGAQTFTFRCTTLDKDLCKPGDNAGWEVVEPRKVKGDDSNINALVSSLRHLSINETISLQEESPEKRKQLLEQYGLDEKSRKAESTRKIRVELKGDKSQTAWFGEKHPINDNFFVARATDGKLNNESVFLIPPYVKTNFDHKLTHWRDKKLFTIASSDVKAFRLDHGSTDISGTLTDGKWTLRYADGGRSVEAPGDIESVDNLITAATYLTAEEIAAEDKDSAAGKKILGGAKEALSLTLTTGADQKKSEKTTLKLFRKGSGDKAETYATVSNVDPVFQVNKSALDRLGKQLKDLRVSKLITSMERFSAQRIALEGGPLGKEPLVLEQSEGNWKQVGSDQPVDTDRLQKLLDKLSGNRIKDYLAEAKKPPSSAITVTLGDEKEPKKRQLALWKSGDKVYARDLQLDRKETFIVDPTIWEALPKKRDYFTAPKSPEEAKKAAAEKAKQDDGHDHGHDHGHGHGHEH